MKKIITTVIAIFTLSSLFSLSLEECKQLALQNNRNYKSSLEIKSAAESGTKAAFTDFLPKVTATGSYTKMNEKFSMTTPDLALPIADAQGNVIIMTDENGNPILDANGNVIVENWAVLPSQELKIGKEDIYLASVNLTQPIFTGGKLLEKYKISKYSREIAESTSKLSRQELLLKTEEYFWRVISLEAKADLADKYKAAVEQHVNDLKNYLNEGVITPNTLLQGEIKLNEAELMQLKVKNGLQLSKYALNQLLGRDLEAELKLEGNLDELHSIPTNKEIRPEITALENAVKISKSAKRVALGNYLPNIALNASYFWANPNPYNGFEEEFGKDWTVGIMAEMQLFSWNKRGFRLAQLEHQKRAAQYSLEETKELISLEIIQAKQHFNEAKDKLLITAKAVKQTEKNLETNKDKFAEGLAKSSDVLDAQTLWQKAVSENISAKTEYQIEYTKLQKAMGNL